MGGLGSLPSPALSDRLWTENVRDQGLVLWNSGPLLLSLPGFFLFSGLSTRSRPPSGGVCAYCLSAEWMYNKWCGERERETACLNDREPQVRDVADLLRAPLSRTHPFYSCVNQSAKTLWCESGRKSLCKFNMLDNRNKLFSSSWGVFGCWYVYAQPVIYSAQNDDTVWWTF